jgi:hypothetical protein
MCSYNSIKNKKLKLKKITEEICSRLTDIIQQVFPRCIVLKNPLYFFI